MPKLTHSEATKLGLHRRKYHGKSQGSQPPYGYRITDAHGTLEPHPEEQRTLEFVRRLAAFKYSTRAIVRILAERGYVSRVAKPFRQTQIVRMLHK